MKRRVGRGLSEVIAGAWVVEKAAHEDAKEPPSEHDAGCIVVISSEPDCSVPACFDIEQDCVALSAADSRTSLVGIAGDKAPSLGPSVDDSKADTLGAASFVQA